MKRRMLSLMLVISIIASLITVLPMSASAETYGKYTYIVENGEVTITDFDDTASGNIAIPSIIRGYPVTAIGESAFYSCKRLTGITIPVGVTSIGYSAFSYCTSLENITIPVGVTSIGEAAFYYCYSLEIITIPSGVTSIESTTFYYCTSLSYISIPESVTSIGDSAFSYCVSLNDMTIPDGVITIGENVFFSCNRLGSITIPKSVTSIGEEAFNYCISLNSINVDKNNPKYLSVDGNLFDKSKTTLIKYTAGKPDTFYSVPEGVTKIGTWAFANCSKLVSISIPNSVTSLEEGAFCECEKLTSIKIPEGITVINGYVFSDCKNLTSITIPDSVKSIGSHAFYGCIRLTKIHMPDGVTSIGQNAFNRCSRLTSITIPSSVTYIDLYAFSNCNSLTDIYYAGNESDWGKILIKDGNDCLTNATIRYSYTVSSIEKNNAQYMVHTNVYGIDTACTILIAGYKNERLVTLEKVPYTKNVEEFAVKEDVDTIKIMAWDKLVTVEPITKVEVLKVGNSVVE